MFARLLALLISASFLAVPSAGAHPLACEDLLSRDGSGIDWTSETPIDLRLEPEADEGGPRFLRARVREVEVLPGYSVYRLDEVGGPTHYVDPKRARISRGTEAAPASPQTKRPVVALDPERMRAFLCPKYSDYARHKVFRDVSRKVRRANLGTSVRVLDSVLNGLTRCGGAGVGMAALAAWAMDRMYRSRERGRIDFLTLHGSNFIIGWILLASTHQCASAILPSRRKELLALALGGDFLANLYFEVDLGGDWQRDGEKKVVTDPADLSTGVLGIASYAVVASALERFFPFSIARACR